MVSNTRSWYRRTSSSDLESWFWLLTNGIPLICTTKSPDMCERGKMRRKKEEEKYVKYIRGVRGESERRESVIIFHVREDM